jgi:hypothetical protein
VGSASDPFDISSSLQVASWRSQRFGCCNLDHFEVKGHLPSSLHHQRQHHHHRLVSYDDDHQVPGIRRTRTTIEIRGPSRIRRLWIFESAGSLCIATTPSLSRPSVYVSHPSRQPRNLELELELELHNWSYYYRPESFKLQVEISTRIPSTKPPRSSDLANYIVFVLVLAPCLPLLLPDPVNINTSTIDCHYQTTPRNYSQRNWSSRSEQIRSIEAQAAIAVELKYTVQATAIQYSNTATQQRAKNLSSTSYSIGYQLLGLGHSSLSDPHLTSLKSKSHRSRRETGRD